MISRKASKPETPPTSSGGRARAPSKHAGETGRVVEGQPLLDFNNVTPVVAEIVRVDEPHARIATEASQRDLALIEQARAVFECHVLDVGIAITKTTDTKLMKMRVPPIESRLDREVKLIESPIQRHGQSSPNRRLDASSVIRSLTAFSSSWIIALIGPPDGSTPIHQARCSVDMRVRRDTRTWPSRTLPRMLKTASENKCAAP